MNAHIELKLNKEFEEIEEIVTSLVKCDFEIIDDVNDKTSLRFVTIDSKLIDIEFNWQGVILRNIIKPHLCVMILNKYIWALEVKF